jgi:hypothetical protein
VASRPERHDFLQYDFPVETRQCKIEHDEIRWGLVNLAQRVEPVADVGDVKAFDDQQASTQLPQLHIVFDYENAGARRQASALSGHLLSLSLSSIAELRR